MAAVQPGRNCTYSRPWDTNQLQSCSNGSL